MAVITSIPLSPMDNIMPRFYANFMFTFRLNPGVSFAAVHALLQESLRRTCDELPILHRRVFALAPTADDPRTGRLEARQQPDWIPQVVANDLSSTWPDYDDLLDAGLVQDQLDGAVLFPPHAFSWDIYNEGAPGLVAQANYVEGGVLLAFGIFHSIIDGTSGSLLMKVWAKHARAIQGDKNPGSALSIPQESCDYRLLEKLWRAEPGNILPSDPTERQAMIRNAPAELWRLLGLLPPATPEELAATKEFALSAPPSAPPPEMKTTIFYVSASNFAALRAAATAESASNPTTTPITANDALMALLWRCIMRAREQAASPHERATDYAPSATSLLDTTLDGRALFSADLPWSYMGTMVFIATTSLPVHTLVSPSTTLAQVATAIRKSVDAITRETLQKAFGLALALEDYGETLRFPFATFEGAEACFTSWVGLSAFDVSFGEVLFANGGRPDHLRPPRREFDAVCRRCVVLPMQVSGGFEVLVSLKREEMEVLEGDGEFARFAKFVCH
ncbi:hypothetical protein N656DRAFT_771749 [Canariomyces notabilis]|uniref:Uncharacterized protein n=1 Tax=Canariomyces notabilis TaxID=2074819 RepID=A0AAN6QE85_9PEZI|nr:hypothetical protein N656DRAFT_771749 [Canariomyces arenarius]